MNDITKDLKSIKTRNHYKVWEPFMRKYHCQKICELGVYKGDNFENMIAHKPMIAVAVDAWRDSGIHPRKYDDYTQEEFDDQYKFFIDRVADKDFVQTIRHNTQMAAHFFPENFFDFIYIDADHSYESCYKDIVAWYPKVKPGRFLAGHDYRRSFGVPKAVDQFIEENNLEMIFLKPSTWVVIKE